jgi:hypothetical protein
MKILVACEESQAVTKAFRDKGHEAYSCDLLDCSGGNPEWHLKMSAIDALELHKWGMVIAHPPCTRLANSGVRWLAERNLWDEMKEAGEFFKVFLDYSIEFNVPVCIENPIPHKYAVEYTGKYSQIIQPWQFGHGETKATCLWLKGLPLLRTTNIVEGREQKIWKMPPSADRAKLRSKTYSGIAAAMADQWG